MRAVIVVGGLLALTGCGSGGGTTGTNYSDTPPVAEIVATPTPKPSETATPEPEATPEETGNAADNAL